MVFELNYGAWISESDLESSIEQWNQDNIDRKCAAMFLSEV